MGVIHSDKHRYKPHADFRLPSLQELGIAPNHRATLPRTLPPIPKPFIDPRSDYHPVSRQYASATTDPRPVRHIPSPHSHFNDETEQIAVTSRGMDEGHSDCEASTTHSSSESQKTAPSVCSSKYSKRYTTYINGPASAGKRERTAEPDVMDVDNGSEADQLSSSSMDQETPQERHNRQQAKSRNHDKRWHEVLQIFQDKSLSATDTLDFWQERNLRTKAAKQNAIQHWLRRTITEESIYRYYAALGIRYAELLEEQRDTQDTSETACAGRWRRIVAVTKEVPKSLAGLEPFQMAMSSFEYEDKKAGFNHTPSSEEGKLERVVARAEGRLPPLPTASAVKKPRTSRGGGRGGTKKLRGGSSL